MPCVGPVIASTMVAAIGDGRAFVKGRDFAAWLVCVLSRRLNSSCKQPLRGASDRGQFAASAIAHVDVKTDTIDAACWRRCRQRASCQRSGCPMLRWPSLGGDTACCCGAVLGGAYLPAPAVIPRRQTAEGENRRTPGKASPAVCFNARGFWIFSAVRPWRWAKFEWLSRSRRSQASFTRRSTKHFFQT